MVQELNGAVGRPSLVGGDCRVFARRLRLHGAQELHALIHVRQITMVQQIEEALELRRAEELPSPELLGTQGDSWASLSDAALLSQEV